MPELPSNLIVDIAACVLLIVAEIYVLYLQYKTNKLLDELEKQVKLAAKIAKENISLQKEITMLKEEHLKEIMAVNDVVRSQEEYVYDLEQKLKTKKAQSKITVKENKIKTQVKKETKKPKKTRKTNKKGEDK